MEGQLRNLIKMQRNNFNKNMENREIEEPGLSSSGNHLEAQLESRERADPNAPLNTGHSQERMCLVNMAPTINMEKPRFPGRTGVHPVTFLEDLASWLKKTPNVGNEIDLIIECLDGQTRNWARVYKERWKNLTDFKKDFLNTYWGEAEQSELRRRIVYSKWDSENQPTMLGHFISLSGQAKMLNYPIPENQLINDIMSHFPKDVQYAWANQANNLLEAAEFLRKLDAINKKAGQTESKERSLTSRAGQKNRYTIYNRQNNPRGSGNLKITNHRSDNSGTVGLKAVTVSRDNSESNIVVGETDVNSVVNLN